MDLEQHLISTVGRLETKTGLESLRIAILDGDGVVVHEACSGGSDRALDFTLLRLLILSEEEQLTLNCTARGSIGRTVILENGMRLYMAAHYDRALKKANGREVFGYLRHDLRRSFTSLSRKLSAATSR